MPTLIGMIHGFNVARRTVRYEPIAYFAYKSARAANKGLRPIGAVELLACTLYGAVLLFASTVGFGWSKWEYRVRCECGRLSAVDDFRMRASPAF